MTYSYAQAYMHISALQFTTKVEIIGSFSLFIKVTTAICTTDNSIVLLYHLKICIEDQAFDDELMIILIVNSRLAKTETTFYPVKLGPRP